jgi:hypothetical protein
VNEPSSHEYSVRIAVLETKLANADGARILQAKEYERRLGDLNHAHQQAMERNATFVSRELYDSGMREVMGFQMRLNDRIDSLSTKVNIGVGIALAVQVLLFIIVEVWKR